MAAHLTGEQFRKDHRLLQAPATIKEAGTPGGEVLFALLTWVPRVPKDWYDSWKN